MEENKNEIRTINQEVKLENALPKFIEPEWMKILRGILEQKTLTKTIKTPNA